MGLDFETYSGVDLLKHGLHQYVNDVTFQPLLAAVTWFDDNRQMTAEVIDLTQGDTAAKQLFTLLRGQMIAAHNAGFEQAVLKAMGLPLPSTRFVDTAVLARAAGAAGKLEAAAPQLLDVDKLESGNHLIKLFSIPGSYQPEGMTPYFDPQIANDHPTEWAEFKRYCAVDAELSLLLADLLLPGTSEREMLFNAVTMDMNNTGWYVDISMVREMRRRYLANVELAVANFRARQAEPDLNLSSFPQLKAWCARRGIRAKSFDEASVAQLLHALDKKLLSPTISASKRAEYLQVMDLLETKQVLGGSSLKKLQTIVDTIGTDGRLHDQYLHLGAGATYRTTGRGVQMQNLPRLHGGGDDMMELEDPSCDWDNDKLSANLRQVFTATYPLGALVVGDFSSVESRGLAWQAGEKWKIDAYFKGQDLYKVQAGVIFNKPADQVTKDERQIGKVGELACGYGAGPDAVRTFAANMGVEMTEGESAKLVQDWRSANPTIVNYWHNLNSALHQALEERTSQEVHLPHARVIVMPAKPPASLARLAPDSASLHIQLVLNSGRVVLSRVIHGCRVVGRNILYYKPSERKGGDLWVDTFTDPKTKQLRKYSVYGGKLAGLLTQSLCREVFFNSLTQISYWAENKSNVSLVGQFHDEIVLDWYPQYRRVTLDEVKSALELAMTSTFLPEFPLAAEIKHDFRYTK